MGARSGSFPPEAGGRILDVGMSQHDDLPGENYFLRRYPRPEQLTAVGIDDITCIKTDRGAAAAVAERAVVSLIQEEA